MDYQFILFFFRKFRVILILLKKAEQVNIFPSKLFVWRDDVNLVVLSKEFSDNQNWAFRRSAYEI